MPPDGQVGVGFSFETLPDGHQIISSMAQTGSAASSGKMVVGDELLSVDGCVVKHFAAPDIISLVKGPLGSQVRLTCSRIRTSRELVHVWVSVYVSRSTSLYLSKAR